MKKVSFFILFFLLNLFLFAQDNDTLLQSDLNSSQSENSLDTINQKEEIMINEDSLNFIRAEMREKTDNYIKKDKKRKDPENLFFYKENYHYYLPHILTEDIRVNGFIKYPNIVSDFQLYQRYIPFLNVYSDIGNLYLVNDDYDLPVLLFKAELSEGYGGGMMDQANLLFRRAKIYDVIKISFGFLGDNGRWLSKQEMKSKNIFLEWEFDPGFVSFSYNFYYTDKNLPHQTLLMKTNKLVDPILDSTIRELPYNELVKEQSFVVRSKFFRVGWDYSYQKLKSYKFGLDKDFYNLSYFYLLNYQFLNQSFALGYEGVDQGDEIKKQFPFFNSQDLYGEGELNILFFNLSANSNSRNKNIFGKIDLPKGIYAFGKRHSNKNKDFDSTYIFAKDAFFTWLDEIEKNTFGLGINSKYFDFSVSTGDQDMILSQHHIKDYSIDKKVVDTANGKLYESNLLLQIPFTIFEYNFHFTWENSYRKIEFEKDYSYIPETTNRDLLALTWNLKHDNKVSVGFEIFSHSEFFTNTLPLIEEGIESQKINDFFIQLNISKYFVAKYSFKNYRRKEDFYSQPINQRNADLNLTWYLLN